MVTKYCVQKGKLTPNNQLLLIEITYRYDIKSIITYLNLDD